MVVCARHHTTSLERGVSLAAPFRHVSNAHPPGMRPDHDESKLTFVRRKLTLSEGTPTFGRGILTLADGKFTIVAGTRARASGPPCQHK